MKSTLKTITLSVAVLAMSVTAFAQSAGPGGASGANGAQGRPGGDPAQRQAMMKAMVDIEKKILAELKLTPDQMKKIAGLDKKRDADRKAMMEKAKAAGAKQDRQAGQEERRKMMAEYRNSLKNILGAAKYATYEKRTREEMQKWAIAHGIPMRGGPGAAGGKAGTAGKGGAGGKGGAN